LQVSPEIESFERVQAVGLEEQIGRPPKGGEVVPETSQI